MASFVSAHKKVGKSEGGYTNNPSDRGNWVDGELVGTNYGISAPVLKDYLGRTPTISDMINLSPKTASDIYKRRFWDRIKGDDIKNQSVANLIYDMYINQTGHTTSVMEDALLYKKQIRIPFSDEVIDAINHFSSKQLFDNIKRLRKQKYEERANTVSGQSQFLSGWLKRLDEFEYKRSVGRKVLFTGLAFGLVIGGYYVYKFLKDE